MFEDTHRCMGSWEHNKLAAMARREHQDAMETAKYKEIYKNAFVGKPVSSVTPSQLMADRWDAAIYAALVVYGSRDNYMQPSRGCAYTTTGTSKGVTFWIAGAAVLSCKNGGDIVFWPTPGAWWSWSGEEVHSDLWGRYLRQGGRK